MPEVPNPHDEEMAARLRAEQDDPLTMYIVVRAATTQPFAKLAADAACATRACVRVWSQSGPWAGNFTAWFDGSFRKVCLRANEKEWEALAHVDYSRCGDVLALPPRRKSERERLIKRLQVYNDPAGELPLYVVLDAVVIGGLVAVPYDNGALRLVVNPAVEMSAGKALAQVAHAALMAKDDERERKIEVFTVADWKALKENFTVAVVRDAGITEIESGSETVAVILDPADVEQAQSATNLSRIAAENDLL